MASVLLRRPFVIGLSAYVRQAALSLDRVSESDWESLRQYYCSSPRVSLDVVCDTLASAMAPYSGRGRNPVDAATAGRLLGSALFRAGARFHARWMYRLRSLIPVPLGHICLVHNGLNEMKAMLLAAKGPPQNQKIALRLSLTYAGALLELRIPDRVAACDVQRVEHFNQALHLQTRPVESVAGDGWWTGR